MNQISRWILFVLGVGLFASGIYATYKDVTPPDELHLVAAYTPWDAETLKHAELIPVQDGGRIKPMSSYASFTMLRLYGARSMKIVAEEGGEGIRIKPLAWMMDAFFRPEFAVEMPSFRVEDSGVLRAIGVEEGEKRDRYSYRHILPGRERLFELAESYRGIEPKQRSLVEKQLVALAGNFRLYEQLLGTFAQVRAGVGLATLEGGAAHADRPRISSLMAPEALDAIRQVLLLSQREGSPLPPHVRDLLGQVQDGCNASSYGLFVFPPSSEDDLDWLSPGKRVMDVMAGQTQDVAGSIVDVVAIENLSRSLADGEGEFRSELLKFKGGIVARAETRGEYDSVALEAWYYRMNWLFFALMMFIFGTVLAIGMWMTGQTIVGKVLSVGVALSTGLAWVLVLIPIVLRSLIMGRPPIGNLYDTIIFIAAAVVMFGAIIELFTRRRFALGVLPIAGMSLVLLARMFEVGDAKDHMDPLVAVLRSNYWLTTHVICITLGYASGLVTALLGMVYVALRGLRLDGGDKNLRRSLTRSVYGMLCLTLFLSLVGTVLGGIWANDSWGRFWGWDPKENGALIIVLACLAILHARLGGFLREWGLNIAAIGLAAVVTFSWWGVNLLGEGMHSYGFAEGGSYINMLYALLALFVLFGLIAQGVEKLQASGSGASLENS